MSASVMDAAGDPQALEKIKKEITCAMCLELFVEPKTLPACLHTFCKSCLLQAEAARRRQRRNEAAQPADRIECPQCRSVSVVTGGVEDITTNFMYANIVEHVKSRDRDGAPTGTTQGQRETTAAADATVPTKHLCPKHPDEKLKLFCFDCDVVICRDCTLKAKDHKDHKFDFIHDIVGTERENLGHMVQPLQENLRRLEEASAELQVARKGVKKIGDERLEEIGAAFDHCVAEVEKRRRHFLERSRAATEMKLNAIDHHGDKLNSVHSQLAKVISFTSEVVQSSSDIEVFMKKKEIASGVKSSTELYKKTQLKVQEEDKAVFVMEMQCLKELGSISEVPCAETSFAEGVRQLIPVQGDESTVTVVAHNSEGRILVHGGGSCTARLSCVPSTISKVHSQEANVTDNKNGSYTVGFVPKYPGKASLEVFFDEERLRGCPFEIDVMRNYSDVMLEPFKFDVPDAKPWGLARLSDNELAFTASDNVVHVYTTQGIEVDTIQSNFTRPYGIWSDREDTLWITDREAHKVQKFSRQSTSGGKFAKIFQFGLRGVNPGQFYHPRGITLHPETGMIYISDMKNHRIQIFGQTSQLPQYKSQFGGPGKSPGLFNLPAGLCFDNRNQLLVCDDHNCRVQVFDPEGRFLHTLGTTPSQKGILCSPIGVACDSYGRYIITEFGSHTVTFMSPGGKVLSCIRYLGPEYGQLVHPRGVACDSVGYVYVADHENMRIVRF